MSDGGLRFKLYVTDATAMGSLRAIANFKRLSQALQESHTLEIIDIIRHPEKALADRIVATPTLVKDFPPPRFKIVGDLSARQSQVNELLGLAGGD